MTVKLWLSITALYLLAGCASTSRLTQESTDRNPAQASVVAVLKGRKAIVTKVVISDRQVTATVQYNGICSVPSNFVVDVEEKEIIITEVQNQSSGLACMAYGATTQEIPIMKLPEGYQYKVIVNGVRPR